jgi:predicted permease
MGFVIRKLNVIDDHGSKKIASLVVRLTSPMLIIDSMIQRPNLTLKQIYNILIIAVFVYIFLFLMTIIVPKLLRSDKKNIGIYKFMIMFSNVGFMGFPVVSSIFGKEAIFHAAIFNIPFYVLAYTLGVYFVCMNQNEDVTFKWTKMINPGIVAVFIGLFFFATKIKLPYVITESVDMVGGLTTPLSMIGIGTSFADVDLKNIYSNLKLYIYAFLKFIVFPVLVFIILTLLKYEGLMIGVPVLITGMPVAANAVMLSKEYEGNDILASEGVFITTLLSVITIPLLTYILTLQ